MRRTGSPRAGSVDKPDDLSGKADVSSYDISLLQTNVLFNNTPLPSAVLDSNFTYLAVNAAFASGLGLNPDEIQSKNHLDLFPGLDHKEQFDAVFASATPFTYTARSADGPIESSSAKYWDLSLSPIQSDTGFTGYALLCLTDATGRIEAMEKLNEQNKRLELAIESAEMGMWEWNMQTDEVYWSDTQYRLYGYKLGEVAPSAANFEKIVLPGDLPLVKQAARDAKSGKHVDISFRVILPNGELRHLSVKASVTLDDNDQPLKAIGTTQDITARTEHDSRARTYEAILNTNQDQIAFIEPELLL